MCAQWYLDAADLRAGYAFGSFREEDVDGDTLDGSLPFFVQPPYFVLEPVRDRAAAAAATRALFQDRLLIDGTELPFSDSDALIEFVRRAYLGSGGGEPPAEGDGDVEPPQNDGPTPRPLEGVVLSALRSRVMAYASLASGLSLGREGPFDWQPITLVANASAVEISALTSRGLSLVRTTSDSSTRLETFVGRVSRDPDLPYRLCAVEDDPVDLLIKHRCPTSLSSAVGLRHPTNPWQLTLAVLSNPATLLDLSPAAFGDVLSLLTMVAACIVGADPDRADVNRVFPWLLSAMPRRAFSQAVEDKLRAIATMR